MSLPTVSDHKDTKFWNQFTTIFKNFYLCFDCFRSQRYKILKPIHNTRRWEKRKKRTVSDHKDTKFWNQFTTSTHCPCFCRYCFRSQRYKILKPIHNLYFCNWILNLLFQITKIQNFETNSQQRITKVTLITKLFQITKIQNFETNSQPKFDAKFCLLTVSDHKDTKFWNQFTTVTGQILIKNPLFQITKIQNFETNSQLELNNLLFCFTVSDHKDTKFWNQFTTWTLVTAHGKILFQITKIQNFETNSQLPWKHLVQRTTVSDHKDTKFWNQFTTKR